MFYQWEQAPNLDRRHRPRTRNGCLTCRIKTKKLRQRLQQQPQNVQSEADVTDQTVSSITDATGREDSLPGDNSSFNHTFNYASFMWDDYSSNLSPSWDTLELSSSHELVPWPDTSLTETTSIAFQYTKSTANNAALIDRQPKSNLPSPMGSTRLAIGWSEAQLAEYFSQSAAPPILATVETSARWYWMRKQLISMTSTSRMVKSGVIAFVALELESAGTLEPATYTRYYRNAKKGLEECLRDISHDHEMISSQLRHILAVLFLLSYIDLLTKDVSKAHANLREGFNALQMVEIGNLCVTEKRLLSWLRLLDARAVSAGGEGLFLTEEESTINTDLRSPDSSIGEVDSGLDDAETALEDFVMRPAFLYFQKVQLFMGRISKIDPWHRRRGTVEDETEVMVIAASIARDIRSLYHQRPPLMDHAVAGRLSTLLSPGLAETITRTMRVYHANYYASFIHLHRVAYKNLPRTTDVIKAMDEIRQVTRLILESPCTSSPSKTSTISTPDSSAGSVHLLPVNMLWPLLMLGAETEDTDERTWVLSCIKGMQNVASNAGITHDVLQEVIRVQDETKQRMDIRKVMHAIFDRAFAIV
ncbi:hypothetical protein N7448_003449 [Penicillium atrosanguineum]|nr:hypothetical protein N7526_009254 [Penicillium atrosanguineum]KAJ5140041.1 hypothetical protein N7448_003449 [Penicillium atrosanguineum]